LSASAGIEQLDAHLAVGQGRRVTVFQQWFSLDSDGLTKLGGLQWSVHQGPQRGPAGRIVGGQSPAVHPGSEGRRVGVSQRHQPISRRQQSGQRPVVVGDILEPGEPGQLDQQRHTQRTSESSRAPGSRADSRSRQSLQPADSSGARPNLSQSSFNIPDAVCESAYPPLVSM